MVNRIWVGTALILLGLVDLLAGWSIDQNGGNSGVLAATSVLALAAGALLVAWSGGEVAVRATGGLLFVAGVAVVVTHHEVWWWLPSGWVTPVTFAALAVALVGLAVLLLAYGFSLAGLSGALGLFALTCLGFTRLPYIGSTNVSALHAWATALGAMALASATATVATRRSTVRWRATTAVAGVVGAAVTLYAGSDSYEVYASDGHHAAVILGTTVGMVACLAFAVIIGRRRSVHVPLPGGPSGHGGLPVPDIPEPASPTPDPVSEPESLSPRRESVTPAVTPGQGTGTATAATDTRADQPAAAQASAATPPAAAATTQVRDRLQTASLAVGLVIGLTTILKELVAAALAIVR
ncbi:hypothetical protein [Micromonospora sp. NPDC005806]|uniref:hypothetical protein n=1 Tax=Micromonospora sp. NPDC005806 TaxID=3364234 RepID=UPI00368B9E8E